MTFERRQRREPLFNALVNVAEPRLESENLLTDDGKTKVPGFDDAGMHRTHRNLVDAVARHAHERILVNDRLGLWREDILPPER